MVLLDTHIWYWWVARPQDLTPSQAKNLRDNEPHGLGVSVMSCWEIAKLVSLGRLALGQKVDGWMRQALAYPGVQLIGLSLEIALEANQLPGTFHRDPVDQLLVATARVLQIPFLTADGKILQYPHVTLLT